LISETQGVALGLSAAARFSAPEIKDCAKSEFTRLMVGRFIRWLTVETENYEIMLLDRGFFVAPGVSRRRSCVMWPESRNRRPRRRRHMLRVEGLLRATIPAGNHDVRQCVFVSYPWHWSAPEKSGNSGADCFALVFSAAQNADLPPGEERKTLTAVLAFRKSCCSRRALRRSRAYYGPTFSCGFPGHAGAGRAATGRRPFSATGQELGYYKPRKKSASSGAAKSMRAHGGRFPSEYDAALALSGHSGALHRLPPVLSHCPNDKPLGRALNGNVARRPGAGRGERRVILRLGTPAVAAHRICCAARSRISCAL